MSTDQLVQIVKDYARANYENGWDVVVETMSDDEIGAVIAGASTPMGAKRKMSSHIGPWNERRTEIQSL